MALPFSSAALIEGGGCMPRKPARALLVLFAAVAAISVAIAEDTDHQFVGYVSDQEDRFVDYVWSFIDEFDNTWTNTQYYWGRCYMLQNMSYANSADLAYLAGHGSPSSITLKGSEGSCYLPNYAWGRYTDSSRAGDLEYIVFQSCKVLAMNSDWRSRWRHYSSTQSQPRPFSGLHVAMGLHTNHVNALGSGPMVADEFAENLEDGFSVRYAWYEAVEDYRYLNLWEDNKPAVFYIRPHENETISQHNSTDYHYGDSSYLLDAYYME
jgi:hypothetical protein